jgi:hypothetical protein
VDRLSAAAAKRQWPELADSGLEFHETLATVCGLGGPLGPGPNGPPGDLEPSGDGTLSSASLVEQAEFDGPYRCLHAVMSPKLGADVPYVPLDGAHADAKVPSDLLVGPSLHHKP